MNWQSCVSCLKNELPSQQFNTWIRPLYAETSPNEVRLYAPNRFVLDWVKEKFLERIRELLSEHSSGNNVDLVFEIGSARQATPAQVPGANISQSAATLVTTLDRNGVHEAEADSAKRGLILPAPSRDAPIVRRSTR